MGQVPAVTSFLLVGGGRVARHFRRYFTLEAIPFTTWIRGDGARALQQRASEADRVLLLIDDAAIGAFYAEHKFLTQATCVHFSGTLSFDAIFGAHPLMTFSDGLYDLGTYRSIPFVLEKGRSTLAALLPGLKNPSFEVDARDKNFYHAMCSMAGNGTVLLWEKAFREFDERLGLPKDALVPYLRRICENLAESAPGDSVLTGPLQREDSATVDRHLRALSGDSFLGVYRAFANAYRGTVQ